LDIAYIEDTLFLQISEIHWIKENDGGVEFNYDVS
jgi:hypothetical protein